MATNQTEVFTITLSVDVSKLKATRKEAIGDEQAISESIIDGVRAELGWVEQSGIVVSEIKDVN